MTITPTWIKDVDRLREEGEILEEIIENLGFAGNCKSIIQFRLRLKDLYKKADKFKSKKIAEAVRAWCDREDKYWQKRMGYETGYFIFSLENFKSN